MQQQEQRGMSCIVLLGANGIYDVVIDTTSINYMDNLTRHYILHQVLAYSGANYSARSSAVFATTYGGGGGGLEIA
jgi:Zn-dependent membrane protease YugP